MAQIVLDELSAASDRRDDDYFALLSALSVRRIRERVGTHLALKFLYTADLDSIGLCLQCPPYSEYLRMVGGNHAYVVVVCRRRSVAICDEYTSWSISLIRMRLFERSASTYACT